MPDNAAVRREALAVRLRATIRRLSREWETRQQAQEESNPQLTVQS